MNDAPVANWIASAGRLNLNHLGAKPGQERSRKGSGDSLPQFEDLDSGERAGFGRFPSHWLHRGIEILGQIFQLSFITSVRPFC